MLLIRGRQVKRKRLAFLPVLIPHSHHEYRIESWDVENSAADKCLDGGIWHVPRDSLTDTC